MSGFRKDVFAVKNEKEFRKIALEVFDEQRRHVPIYKEFVDQLKGTHFEPQSLEDIPFLPISFFKTHAVLDERKEEEQVFLSSGTTGMVQSNHHVASLDLYETSFLNAFNQFYGAPSNYVIMALLPAYLEKRGIFINIHG